MHRLQKTPALQESNGIKNNYEGGKTASVVFPLFVNGHEDETKTTLEIVAGFGNDGNGGGRFSCAELRRAGYHSGDYMGYNCFGRVSRIRTTKTAPVRQTEPAQPDAAELAFPEEAEPEISYPLDLNAATAEELETLPGVGAILAERIVSYREAVGGFQTLEELQQVNGIGSGIYSQIAPYLTGYTAIRIIRANDARGEDGIGFRIHSPSGHQHHGRGFSKAAERHAGTGGSHCSAADTDSVFSEYL